MLSLDEILYNGHAVVAVFIEQREREANLQIQVLGVDDFLKLGFEQLKTKLMQCELCQEFAYAFGASAVQLPEELLQNKHYSTTVTLMVNAGAYPGFPQIF